MDEFEATMKPTISEDEVVFPTSSFFFLTAHFPFPSVSELHAGLIS
ncbi:unnamed protein product [Haemonchus placei]|uniref:Uncharacterized protein n=1 Tax=Haemonchus placei TaxID=6290 RepID=A0A0N4WBD7_HAEPC|nr:unnamed protein product [Haemonchus placei]